jgi:hypothetical protein
MRVIIVWPCGAWVPREEFNEDAYIFMGDDYMAIPIEDDMDDDEIGKAALAAVSMEGSTYAY